MTINSHCIPRPRPTLVRFPPASLLALLLVFTSSAHSQVTVKPDGQWRSLTTAGLTVNSGNTRSTAFNLSLDGVRATESSKWSALAQLLYTDSAGQRTGERALVSSQYNGDFEPWRTTFAVLLPSLRENGLLRTEFDGQVSVAISERVSLSTGLSVRHTTRPAPGQRSADLTLVTGLSLRYD